MAEEHSENPTVAKVTANGNSLTDDRVKARLPKQQSVQLGLSFQNRLVLLVAVVVALMVLMVLYLTGGPRVTRSGQQAGEKTNLVEITYEEMFREIAPQYGLDWQMLARQAYRESGFNPQAVGQDNDAGLMQIIPSTWDEWAPQVGASDPLDPYSNVQIGRASCRERV